MSTLEQIQQQIKDAMRAKDKARIKVLRMITATVKQVEVDERTEVDESRMLSILEKMVKQRRDAIAQFEAAGRDELAAGEQAEIVIIQEFLPEPLSESEVEELIRATITETGASSMKDMEQVMGLLKQQVQGRADMGQLSSKIKSLLT